MNIPDDLMLQPFRPCVLVNHEARTTECVYEDVPCVHVPIFKNQYHYADKMLAMDDGRVVGIILWHSP